MNEDTAIAWAQGYVREHGEESEAFIYHRVLDQDRNVDPVPAQHRVFWLDGELGMSSWPERTRAEVDLATRQALDRICEPGGYAGPAWKPVTSQPFKLLPGGRGQPAS